MNTPATPPTPKPRSTPVRIPVKVVMAQPTQAPPPPPGWPLWRLGFRPFYLLGAAWATLAMVLWLFVFTGRLPLPQPLAPVWWHAHEMLFGFVVAIVIGFLLTAGKAWTNLPTPRGPALAALAALWLLARIAALCAPYPVFFALDATLLPVVAAHFVSLLVRSKNQRNAIVGAVLVLLAAANFVFHLAASGVLALDPLRPLYAGIALVVLLESIIGGRIIPSFTMNATPGLKLTESRRRDLLALVLTGLGLTLWVLGAPEPLNIVVLLAATVLNIWRAASWRPAGTLGRPILWILHLAYAWIPLGLALLAAAQAGLIPASPAIHALTVGSMGGLIIGMITRTARGHTSRPLNVERDETAAYALVLGAAAVRVLVPLALPTWTNTAYLVAGAMWALAFALYLVRYTPWLTTTRLDGRDG